MYTFATSETHVEEAVSLVCCATYVSIEQNSEDGNDVPALSALGYSLKRMTDEEVSTAALSLTANQASKVRNVSFVPAGK